MDRFLELRSFTEVVDAGSFVAAADQLSLSKAAISRHVAELEARLGVRLLHRTTRKLSLTDEGEVFYARSRDVLAGLEEAEAELTSRSREAVGQLRVSAPVSFGIQHLAPVWGQFRQKHPKVALEVNLSDRVADLAEEGFDVAIRIARLPSSSLVSRQLAATRMVLCASPPYLKRAGKPAHPSDLARHAVVAYSYWSERDTWEFDGPEGRVAVRTDPWLRTNNGDVCRAAALQHQGIILQPTFIVGADLASGKLVEVLPRYRSLTLGIHAVYQSRKHLTPKVRLLVDFLVRWFREERWPR
ncbi:LysR family transcriptional regulator [Ramlibacter sp. XY19]|uniref:LysR family transcriptional regulator n=1 Tax=Ramlibacter paludis TaxID=2908000 RepID=UPI0023DB70B7|nr:LysR family transcriptional regulator [Ramlibacter paludis]MCG2591932.1 LysR family transcriptional regulator [Ramlibacter paludis]